MEDTWLTWAKRLQAIASTGLHFTRDQYDAERYQDVAEIANQMLSMLGNVPINRIENLVGDFSKGYATPKIDVRGAVLRDDTVLLVKEKTDGRWSMPGGYAEVGISASDNVVKEVQEEANLDVSVVGLYAVHHKARHAYNQDARDFYKMFFLCNASSHSEPKPGAETAEAAFFSLSELPPLSHGRVITRDIEAAFAFRDQPNLPTQFD